jgi:3-oxoacyl-[acyl-carrier protein] reductase
MRLTGKFALVTGVAGPMGIGYASAKRMAEEGASVAIADISDEVYERAKELRALAYDVAPFKLDLTDFQEVNLMVGKVHEKFGRIDILANIAGIGPRGTTPIGGAIATHFVDLTEEAWEEQIGINLKTNFNCTRAVLPIMITQRYGKIVNMSSVTGTLVSDPGASAYSAAKGGVSGLTKALALEVAEYGITVNAIAPGWIDTGREIERKAGLASPMERAGRPGEVANLVLFLASDESSYLNGHDIVIDGGNILQEYKGTGEL